MPSLREIRNKIKSVKSTEQITKAVKMVAAARMRRSQLAILSARPFAVKMEKMVTDLALLQEREDLKTGRTATIHPFFQKHDKGSELLILVAGDKGLCGAFNANILRAATEWFRARQGQKVYCVAVGRKSRDFVHRLRGMNIEVLSELVGVFPKISFAHAELVGQTIIDAYLSQRATSITVLYNEFKSVAQQRLLKAQLLPITAPAIVSDRSELPDYGFEPGRPQLLSALLPRTSETQHTEQPH